MSNCNTFQEKVVALATKNFPIANYSNFSHKLLTIIVYTCIINIENEKPQTWFANLDLFKNALNRQVTDAFFCCYSKLLPK